MFAHQQNTRFSLRKILMTSLVAMATSVGATTAQAGMVTPDIIFGSGNNNRGFEIDQNAPVGVELGLRAKLRFGPGGGANDQLGVGIIQDPVSGAYLFDSNLSSAPANRAMWSFDWSINTNFNGNGGALDSLVFDLLFDIDPTSAVNFAGGNPLDDAANAWLGNGSTGNGAGVFTNPLDASSRANNSVAQNSVNYGFIPGAPLGDGEYTVQLRAFADTGGDVLAQTSIDVIVGPGVGLVPVPATLSLLSLGLLALRLRRNSPL